MNSHIYIDKGNPVVSKVQERLTDGSKVWNIVLNGREVPFASEHKADEAFTMIAEALRCSCGEVLVL